MLKKIIIIVSWVVLIAGLVVLLSFVEEKHNQMNCGKVDLLIQYNEADYLITVDDVFHFLKTKGIKIKDIKIKDVNVGNIESILYQIPYIEKADVFMTIEGNVGIKIVQKKPLIKVFNQFHQSFYIDDKGKVMPISPDYSARVIVANGYIENMYHKNLCLADDFVNGKDSIIKKSSLYKVYKIAQFIQKNEFWSAMTEEIFVNKNKEIELYTKIGDHAILFGDINQMNEKFEKLYAFYKQVLNKTGWEQYKVINLKFKNQIVCSKI